MSTNIVKKTKYVSQISKIAINYYECLEFGVPRCTTPVFFVTVSLVSCDGMMRGTYRLS